MRKLAGRGRFDREGCARHDKLWLKFAAWRASSLGLRSTCTSCSCGRSIAALPPPAKFVLAPICRVSRAARPGHWPSICRAASTLYGTLHCLGRARPQFESRKPFAPSSVFLSSEQAVARDSQPSARRLDTCPEPSGRGELVKLTCFRAVRRNLPGSECPGRLSSSSSSSSMRRRKASVHALLPPGHGARPPFGACAVKIFETARKRA